MPKLSAAIYAWRYFRALKTSALCAPYNPRAYVGVHVEVASKRDWNASLKPTDKEQGCGRMEFDVGSRTAVEPRLETNAV